MLGVITRDSMSSSSGARVSDEEPKSASVQPRYLLRKRTPQILHQLLILSDIVHGDFRLRMSRREIVFATPDRAEEGSERCRERRSRGEQSFEENSRVNGGRTADSAGAGHTLHGISEHLGVLQDLFRSLLNDLEFPVTAQVILWFSFGASSDRKGEHTSRRIPDRLFL
jgi:hypothetical protein